ncbi:MAG: class I SAM-dependent methyltransferase [Gammaproteobacteria bacterium]|nr:MAG: class I SAM-dependent methyltransferase [Gammaproteobacteria bacterium]
MDRQNFNEWLPGCPLPSDSDWQRSETLVKKIRERICRQERIPFSEYMQLALYTPELGYYTGQSVRFDEQGDFTTAPNISPVFGACLARQCQQVLQKLGSGRILELGAGNGQMAVDILTRLEQEGMLPQAYQILECSPMLRVAQQETLQSKLPHVMSRVEWLDSLPSRFEGVIVANEFLDALPVERLRWTGQRWLRSLVSMDENENLVEEFFTVEDASLGQAVEHVFAERQSDLCEGYTTEMCPLAAEWASQLSGCLHQGLILLLDYGYPRSEYYHPQRTNGTLTCFYRHRRHDNPLIIPGLQDISCHVDFTRLVEVAVEEGVDLSGFNTQAAFLMACGLGEWMEKQGQAEDIRRRITRNDAVDRLLAPGEMGELVKVIGFQKGIEEPMLGFGLQDMSYRL